MFEIFVTFVLKASVDVRRRYNVMSTSAHDHDQHFFFKRFFVCGELHAFLVVQGLQKFEEMLTRHGVTFAMLAQLSMAELKALGVEAKGAQVKLLRAAPKWCTKQSLRFIWDAREPMRRCESKSDACTATRRSGG